MAKIAKNVVDADLRAKIFECLFETCNPADYGFDKINDRQMGVILVDKNGVERYCRVGVIVAEEREGMTAKELMDAEIADYQTKQANKAEKAAKKAEKIAKDKAKREAKEKEAQGDGE